MLLRMRLVDISGTRFGRLVAVRVEGKLGGKPAWRCQCDCGNTLVVRGNALRIGNTRSCGCLHIDSITSHGRARSREYNSWQSMLERCRNPNCLSFHRYGARGITVCPRWEGSFELFFKDMGERPSGTSLDRIDNNGNYEPDNCRWANRTSQNNNRSDNRFIEHEGAIKTLSMWAREHGLTYFQLRHRLGLGWPMAAALSTPILKQRSRKPDGTWGNCRPDVKP